MLILFDFAILDQYLQLSNLTIELKRFHILLEYNVSQHIDFLRKRFVLL